MVLASIVEVLSIGAVAPFLAVLSSPARFYQHPMATPVIERFGITEPQGLILPAAILFCIGAIASGVLRYMLLVFQTRVTYAIGVDLSVAIFERTLYQPYLIHVSRNSSEVISGISNKANELIVSLLFPATIIASSAIMLSVVFGVLLAIEPSITIMTVIAFSSYYALMTVFNKRRMYSVSNVIATQFGNVIKLIQEGLGGIRDILLDGTQQTFVRSYRESESALRQSRATALIMSGTPRFVIETLGTLFITGLALHLTTNSNGLTSAIPMLGAITLASQRLIPVMQQLYSSWAAIASGRSSVADALALLEQPMPANMEHNPRQPLAFEKSIQFADVSFRYTAGSTDVLSKVNITICRGTRLGIIGETGSGKSTFLDLLMGLTTPTSGNILIDGSPLTGHRIRAWQLQVAHVPQAIYLADSTVAENIAFGIPANEIDQERVRRAAQVAQVHEVIERLPMGYQTLVGERGARLSGGQRQRLGIARAIYKQARVIILDEATSALDSETESAVMDAIHALPQRVTLVIVAHRLNTLRKCNSLIRVKSGRLEQSSDFASLLVASEGT